jgi:uncharacterized lipoprotein
LKTLVFNAGAVIDRNRVSGCSGRSGAIAAVALCLCVCGCAGGGGKRACSKPQEYQSSETTSALMVPNDLDEPDRSGKLLIPEAREEDEEPGADRPCLDQPPDYFDRKL